MNLVRYVSEQQTSKCLCKTVASIRKFTLDLVANTRPYLTEARRKEVTEDLIDRAINALEKEKRFAHNHCCKRKFANKKPEVKRNSAGIRNTTARKSCNKQLGQREEKTTLCTTLKQNTKGLTSPRNLSKQRNEKLNVKNIIDISRAGLKNVSVSSLPKGGATKSSVEINNIPKKLSSLPKVKHNVKQTDTPCKQVQTIENTPKPVQGDIENDKKSIGMHVQTDDEIFSIKPNNHLLTYDTESTRPCTTNQTSQANVTIERNNHGLATVEDLLKNLNINVNVTVNGTCNATNGKQNLVKYVMKHRSNKKKKRQNQVDFECAELYETALDKLESPALISSISSEIDHLNNEFCDMISTIDRLKKQYMEEEEEMIWFDEI